MVLLICTLVNLHVTIHAEKTGHILTGTDQSTFRLFFSDLRFQDTLSGIPACIFMKKIQLSTHPKLLNMEIIVTRMSNVFLMLSGYSFQIWLKNLPFYSSLLLVQVLQICSSSYFSLNPWEQIGQGELLKIPLQPKDRLILKFCPIRKNENKGMYCWTLKMFPSTF